jgi:hypothetical protein
MSVVCSQVLSWESDRRVLPEELKSCPSNANTLLWSIIITRPRDITRPPTTIFRLPITILMVSTKTRKSTRQRLMSTVSRLITIPRKRTAIRTNRTTDGRHLEASAGMGDQTKMDL